MKLGDKTILENIIGSLIKSGIVDVYISLNYKADVIEDYFGDGSDFGAKITYLREDRKLGTAGALTLLPETPSKPVLVINGDVVPINTYNSFITSDERMIGIVDVEDLIVIDTKEALLICKRGSSENVKELVDYLRSRNVNHIL